LKKKKIHTALESLDIYELNAFSKFIDSPYFNQNEKISNYFHLLEAAIRNGEDLTEIEDQTAWEYCTKEPYEDVKFRKLSSDLYKLFERFLSQTQFDADDFAQTLSRLKNNKIRKNEIFERDLEKQWHSIESKSSGISSEDMIRAYLMKQEFFKLKVEHEKKAAIKNSKILDYLKDMEYDLDRYYLVEKLRIYNTLLSWSKLTKVDLNYNKFEKFISRIARDLFENEPSIKIYNDIYQLSVNPNNLEKFYDLKELMKKHRYDFSLEEQREIHEAAVSFCINRLNRGDDSMNREIFELYQEAIRSNILIEDANLSPTTFRNIIAVALRLDEFEWVEKFISEFSPWIEVKYRDNAIYFNTARLYFYQRKYGEVVENLQKVTYEDIWYNLNTRSILILAYYELEEFDVLDSHLTSFKTFLNREKSLGSRKTHYLHLIKYVKYLINTNYNDQKKLQDLRQQVVETQGVVNKQWLLEKIDALIK